MCLLTYQPKRELVFNPMLSMVWSLSENRCRLLDGMIDFCAQLC
jgi:hypothetical protein